MRWRGGIDVQAERVRGKGIAIVAGVAEALVVDMIAQDTVAAGLQRFGLVGGDGDVDDVGPIGLDRHPGAVAVERGDGIGRRRGRSRQPRGEGKC